MVAPNPPQGNADLVELLRRVASDRERIILDREGTPVAALGPIEDLQWLEEMEDLIDAEMARKALAEGGPTEEWEVIKKRYGL